MIKIPSGNALLNPLHILQEANIGYGEIVADLGAGAGHFTMQAAKMVGDRGLVYAVDVVKSVLKNLESRAKLAGIGNIKTVWSNLEVIGGAKAIPNNSADCALIVNVLFQSHAKKEKIFKEAFRMLKTGGRLLVIDWKKTPSPIGPPVTSRLSLEDVTESLVHVGFLESKTFSPGEHHWAIIVTKP